MGIIDLYRVRGPLFAGIQSRRENTVYSILGAPLDATASYRRGQGLAPRYIREASENIESNGYYVRGLMIEDVSPYDEGDIALPIGDVGEALSRIGRVVREIVAEGRIPIVIGGEHTITLGTLTGFIQNNITPCLIVFDAHLDLRRDYMGEELSHATVMRRIIERVRPTRILYIGVRAYATEEISLIESMAGIEVIYSWEVDRIGPANAGARARIFLEECNHTYISIDMDVYDPSHAPGVGNPEPPGLRARDVLRLLVEVVDERVRGLDLVEVTPPYDATGITGVLAAKTLQEALLAIEAARRSVR